MELIKKRESQLEEEPVVIRLGATSKNVNMDVLDHHQVMVVGKFLHDKEVYLGPRSPPKDFKSRSNLSAGAPSGQSGYYIYTPLRREDG